MRTVSLSELCIGKLIAMLDRVAPRDAWDVARLPGLKAGLLGDPAFRVRFLALASVLDHPVTSYTKERLTSRLVDRSIREQLVPMLMSGTKPTAVALIEEAWQVVGPLLELSKTELSFVTAIQRGEFRAGLLGGPDVEILANHPAIGWKLTNARKHLEGAPQTPGSTT